MIFEIPYFDPKLGTWTDLVSNYNVPDFYKIWHSEQIEYAN